MCLHAWRGGRRRRRRRRWRRWSLLVIEGDPLNTKEVEQMLYILITAGKGGVVRAKGEGEKEECTTESKRRRRRDDEKAPWALN